VASGAVEGVVLLALGLDKCSEKPRPKRPDKSRAKGFRNYAGVLEAIRPCLLANSQSSPTRCSTSMKLPTAFTIAGGDEVIFSTLNRMTSLVARAHEGESTCTLMS
jgi:hypothetical protein